MAYQSGGLNFYSVIGQWQQAGFYDIVLPFLLVFAIAFGVLQKVNLFGTDTSANKKINAIVAFVLGLLFLQNQYLVFILQRFLPNMSLIIIVLLMFLLIIGILGRSTNLAAVSMNAALIFSIVVTLIALSADFVPGFNLLDWFYSLVPDTATQSTLLLVLMIVIIVIGVIKSGGSAGKGKEEETSH